VGQPPADHDDISEGDHHREIQGLRREGADTFWGTLFQLAVSPFSWIDSVMEDVAWRVGKMLDKEAEREPDGEETEEHN
jgi:hypothetical protein